MSRICVLGGSGFLGSHVADKLSEIGHDVAVVDRLRSVWLRKDQEMVIADLLDPNSIDKAIDGAEIVYNFAGLADLNQALTMPVKTIELNVLGNMHVLEACKKAGVDRYLFASSIYVYSREGGFYRCSKQSAEHYIEEYQNVYGLNYTILRYGSLYGPRSGEDNGLFRIIRDALIQGKISYEGDPESVREYIHVEDAANSSVTALGTDFLNQSVILTGQQSMRVSDLLSMLSEILDFQESPEFRGEDYAGHYVRTPYAYQPKLGRKYSPSTHVDLGQGLLQIIDDIRQQL
jgi:UDP-glucose 4-epimerase